MFIQWYKVNTHTQSKWRSKAQQSTDNYIKLDKK